MARKRTPFYWIGWILGIACIAVVFAHHSGLPWRFEFEGISLVWILGGGALFAILVHEFCDSLLNPQRDSGDAASASKPPNETPVVRFRKSEVTSSSRKRTV